jgi:hypothetical protein
VSPSADSLRAVLDSVFAGPAYVWTEPWRPFAFLDRWWTALLDWLVGLNQRNPQVFEALFWGLVAGLALIFVHAGWVLFRTVRAAGAASGPAAPAAAGQRRDAAWWRTQAGRLAGEGRYAEAMPFDFLALVLELDQRQLLRYHPATTPGEYTRDARLPDAARRELREVVRDLYAAVFARRPCDAEQYRAWRARTDGQRYAPAH